MDLQQVEETLPNGFHDARLLGITARFDRSRLEMDLELSVGDPDAASTDGRDAYKKARLTLNGLEAVVIEPPRSNWGGGSRPLNIDAGPDAPPGHDAALPPVPPGCFRHWFFVSAWNSFIVVVARDADVQWTTQTGTAAT
jgi:hypothetical protein